ncbi:unnamed protein product [Ceratitis capitata]|uniref:(Mediterranean fruit fly) hypothetical protein n=1 Tax=Ceratitis capitata TaxID=7213 RepID=A0A811V5V4_CERCA|nr:unnamed protein product [Ceratitis capitata]
MNGFTLFKNNKVHYVCGNGIRSKCQILPYVVIVIVGGGSFRDDCLEVLVLAIKMAIYSFLRRLRSAKTAKILKPN